MLVRRLLLASIKVSVMGLIVEGSHSEASHRLRATEFAFSAGRVYLQVTVAMLYWSQVKVKAVFSTTSWYPELSQGLTVVAESTG